MSIPESSITQSPNSPVGVARLLNVFADFLDLDVGAGDAATDTLITYKRQLIQFLDWCDHRQLHPAEITKDDIKKYRRWMIDKKGFKPATIALKLSVVRRFYQAALEKGLLSVNPAAGVKAPKEKRDPAEKITYLEASEVEHFFATITDDGSLKSARDKALLAILTLEGPRTVELHRANISDIVRQGKNWGIRVEGKRNIRIVPLTPEIAQLLRVYLERREATEGQLKPSSPLFIAVGNRAGGKRISRRGIRLIVDGYLQEAELKHTPGRTLSTHSLRHTAGTLAIAIGGGVASGSRFVGTRRSANHLYLRPRWRSLGK